MRIADPDDTIDVVDPAHAEACVVSPRQVAAAATTDYAELVAVERRHYAIEGEIAKGGMGRVVAARDLRLGREVAIKELLPKNRDAARRFEREARITARLQHPAIIHIYEAGVWPGGEPFYAMNKVDGRSLDKVVAERATLVDRLGLLPNVIAVADALAYAHSQRVIHRDLKPANVLVGEFGETVVIDWGLAKDLGAPPDLDPKQSMQLRLRAATEHTVSGSVVGTPAYMPPEQARGDAVDQRADVYALGALLYKVLGGRAPYAGRSVDDVIEQVKAGSPPPLVELEPGAPPDLVAIVAKAMARDPDDRYPSAGALALDLKRFQTGQLVAAHRYTPRQLLWRWLRRHRVAVTLSAVAIVAVAAVATISVRRILYERDRAELERDRAEARRAALLEERGRSELLDGHPGPALAYLAAAAHDGARNELRGFLIAEAMRAFEARVAPLEHGLVVAVSPDGEHLALGGVDEIQLWSADGVRREQRLAVHGRVRALAYDPTGARLAAADDDDAVQVWAADGARVGELAADHHGAITDLAFGPDGRMLVRANADGFAEVWDVATGHVVTSKCEHRGPVASARLSPDGERVVTASEHAAYVWSARTGYVISPLRGHTATINSVRWVTSNWVLTASDDGTALVSDAERGKPVVAGMRHAPGTTVNVAEVSADGRLVLTAGSDHVARVWALPASVADDAATTATAKPVSLLLGHGQPIVAAAFSDDDDEPLVATAADDGLVKVWAPRRGQVLASFEHDDVRSLAFAGRGRVVSAGRDGIVHVWRTTRDSARVELSSPVHAIAVAADGTVAAGTDDSRVALRRPDGTTTILRGHLGRVFAVAFTPDGKRLISGGEDPRPIVWDVASGHRVGELGVHDGGIRAIAISHDGRTVATAAKAGVWLWSLAGAPQVALADRGATITAVTFSRDDALVIAGADDGQLIAWTRGGDALASKSIFAGEVRALALAPGDATVAVAGARDVVRLAFANGRFGARAAMRLADAASDVAFTSDGTRIITAGRDGIAKIWDAESGKVVATRDARGFTLEALAIRGDTLWLASEDGTIAATDIGVARASATELDAFVREHDPWELDDADVVKRADRRAHPRPRGGSDGER